MSFWLHAVVMTLSLVCVVDWDQKPPLCAKSATRNDSCSLCISIIDPVKRSNLAELMSYRGGCNFTYCKSGRWGMGDWHSENESVLTAPRMLCNQIAVPTALASDRVLSTSQLLFLKRRDCVATCSALMPERFQAGGQRDDQSDYIVWLLIQMPIRSDFPWQSCLPWSGK